MDFFLTYLHARDISQYIPKRFITHEHDFDSQGEIAKPCCNSFIFRTVFLKSCFTALPHSFLFSPFLSRFCLMISIFTLALDLELRFLFQSFGMAQTLIFFKAISTFQSHSKSLQQVDVSNQYFHLKYFFLI